MTRSFRIALAVAACWAAMGCQAGRTQVLLVIDTDLEVPDELDEVRVDLIGPSGETRRSEGSITGPQDLPRTLGIVDETHTARMVRVTITGLRGGANVIQRRGVFTFVPGETRMLRMDLLRGCVGVSCPSDQTCGDNGCRSSIIGQEELAPYDPAQIRRADGGVDGGTLDACVPSDEICNQADDDCDRTVDEGFDLRTDMRNCGACGNACDPSPELGSSACEAGVCVLRCDLGQEDCNGLIEDGCETDLSQPGTCGRCDLACASGTPFCQEKPTGYECVESCLDGTTDCSGACVDPTSDPRHCGGCGRRCTAPPNAVATCMGGACSFECDPGFADCDGRAENGCESTLRDLANCGRCGATCVRPGGVASCETGTCQLVACDPLRGDCDGNPANGCEEDLSTPARCGTCSNACPTGVANGTVACQAGRCVVACTTGFGDCDGMLSTGCEASVATTSACGTCGVACSDPTPLCAPVAGGFRCTSDCATTTCGSSCVDTATDPRHCGRCDNACPTAMNAVASCTGGTCGLTCASGFGDCDTNLGTGCEVTLGSSAEHCGRCGNACTAPPNAIATCASGTCGFRCRAGFEDCNGMASDGCEVAVGSDLANCGRCGNRCMATGGFVTGVACTDGVCAISACVAPNADCDASFANGCEVDTDSNRNHCGMCGNACGAGRRCCGGQCRRNSECP
jgi:hypothetical protein